MACHVPERLPCTIHPPLADSGAGHVPPTGKREWYMVRKEGFEPSSLAAQASETCAYASSATSAFLDA